MDNIIITFLYPSYLVKIKPYQNFSLIISGITLLISFTLSWFDNKLILDIAMYLFLSGTMLLIPFILLSLPFLFKRTEIAEITKGTISINVNHTPAEFNIQELRFLLNIDSRLFENGMPVALEIKDLCPWGNYIIIPKNPTEDIHIQFIPNEDFLEILPQLKVHYKSRSVLLHNTTNLLKDFMDVLWSASVR